MLLKPALPGTSMSTPGTMKTSGERRSTEPRRPPTTPTVSVATKTAACSAENRGPELVRAEREDRCTGHEERISGASPQREREGEPGRDCGQELDADEDVLRGGRGVDHPEPARRDRSADPDAEGEPEELDERARGVRDAGLEVLRASSRIPVVNVIPGRKVTMAASVTTSGEASMPRWTSATAQKLAAIAATGATIGSRGPFARRQCDPADDEAYPAAAAASDQPPPSTGVSAAPASAYAASMIGHFRSSGVAWMCASAASACAGSSRSSSTSWIRSSRREIAFELDGRRLDSQCVAALARKRPERDLDDGRGRGDLRLSQPERGRERENALLQVSSRVAGPVRNTREAQQELDSGRVGCRRFDDPPLGHGSYACSGERLTGCVGIVCDIAPDAAAARSTALGRGCW